MAGWGSFLGKIAEQFQGRVERLKNERDKLIKEKASIMQGTAGLKETNRVSAINKRLDEINAILTNKASD